MYNFGDVTRLPEYGRDDIAWLTHQDEVIERSNLLVDLVLAFGRLCQRFGNATVH